MHAHLAATHAHVLQYWDPEIAEVAQHLAESCYMHHDKNRNMPGAWGGRGGPGGAGRGGAGRGGAGRGGEGRGGVGQGVVGWGGVGWGGVGQGRAGQGRARRGGVGWVGVGWGRAEWGGAGFGQWEMVHLPQPNSVRFLAYELKVGQNLAMNYADWTAAIMAWFSEIDFYEYGVGQKDGTDEAIGHYTAVRAGLGGKSGWGCRGVRHGNGDAGKEAQEGCESWLWHTW